MLATRISFMNDMALLCEKVGADVDLVRKGMGADKRIGYPFLFPGVGYGGCCFPKDVKALVATARDFGIEFDLLRAVERTNERPEEAAAAQGDQALRRHRRDARSRVWGLAFKPKTDDMREAPSLVMHRGAAGQGREGRGARPGRDRSVAKRHFGDRVRYAETPYEALEGADALFVAHRVERVPPTRTSSG